MNKSFIYHAKDIIYLISLGKEAIYNEFKCTMISYLGPTREIKF